MNGDTTVAPVKAGSFAESQPEFGRCSDVQRIFGIRRGTAYNLLKDGKIRGCLLRVRGTKSGVRLFHMDSIRQFIKQQMEAAQETGGLN